MSQNYDVIIIGGGFFGMYIAEFFATRGKMVLLCEKDSDFMQRASYVNQARVHNGYHYPRSILTALRSRISFPRFCEEFAGCIDSSFEKYYMVGKLLSKVTAKQFEIFCHRIGAICEPAPNKITRLVNPELIEAVFKTVEYAFDSIKLKNIMLERLEASRVNTLFNATIKRINTKGNGLEVEVAIGGQEEGTEFFTAQHVFNCTYSMINYTLTESGLEPIPLKHELAEICLVEVPDEIKDIGITVMCGPFFSVMPFPPLGLHSFSHVRYTPHYEWYDGPGKPYVNAHRHLDSVEKKSAWRAMQLDAKRYMPVLSQCNYEKSIWEIKTVLPRSETDDSRPILFRPNYGIDGFHCVMGGKIDNIYDVIAEIESLGMAS